ncbi:MAG: PadR family transcriptional regulator [Clostridia bacterium]|nr:PadR family transcriptional regulator [Clostridia bacterium]
MDAQLKRGLLDVCVLAAIRDGESYGYKIIKDLKPCVALSESTLYTILKRLEGAKMLTVRAAEHDGRLRKYYRITEDGLSRLREFKEEWQEVFAIYEYITKREREDA